MLRGSAIRRHRRSAAAALIKDLTNNHTSTGTDSGDSTGTDSGDSTGTGDSTDSSGSGTDSSGSGTGSGTGGGGVCGGGADVAGRPVVYGRAAPAAAVLFADDARLEASGGKAVCDWEDPAAREALVAELAADASAVRWRCGRAPPRGGPTRAELFGRVVGDGPPEARRVAPRTVRGAPAAREALVAELRVAVDTTRRRSTA